MIKIKRGLTRFERVIEKTKITEGCWEYQGYKDKDGYGRIKDNGVMVSVHRYIYEMAYEKLGELQVLHACDNPSCIRPAHLAKGTTQDNTADKIAKGRARYSKGEEIWNSTLTVEQVISIRRDYEESDKSRGVYVTLANKYGTTRATVGKIIRRERWKWLK